MKVTKTENAIIAKPKVTSPIKVSKSEITINVKPKQNQ